MDTQYWGTFSIYDYQTPLYRRSLVLFDKVVIPIPKEPIKSVTQQEIDRLSQEVLYLKKEGLAEGVEWEKSDFELWRESHSGEAIAQLLDKDRQLATRLQVQESVKKNLTGKFAEAGGDIRAIPVYADWKEFDSAWKSAGATQVFDIVARQLPVPADDAPLEDIVELRGRKSFQESMHGLRSWQDSVLLDLLKAEGKKEIQEATLKKAVNVLEKWMKQYESALEDAKFKKVRTAVISVLAVSAALCAGAPHLIATLSALAPPLFDFRTIFRPCWQSTTNLECAPIGVVYEATAVLGKQ